MVARPTDRPRWATDPGTTTEPTEGMKDSGYPPDEPPERTPTNWLFNVIYQGLEWFYQAEPRESDWTEDHALPGDSGDRPSTGAGLTITETDFEAGVFVDGYRVPPTVGPGVGSGFTAYATNKDTYWDLGVDGVWEPAIVNSGAGAPAVPAGMTRVFRVRTNGTDRLAFNGTDSLDYRAERPRFSRPFDITDLRLAALNTVKNVAATTAELIASRLTRTMDLNLGGHALRYQAFDHLMGRVLGIDSTSYTGFRLYARYDTDAHLSIALVWGAKCTTPSGANAAAIVWTAERTRAVRIMFKVVDPTGAIGGLRFASVGNLDPGVPDTFTDATWESSTHPGAIRYQLPLGFGLKLGASPMNPDATNGNIVPLIEFLRGTGIAFTEIMKDHGTGMPWSSWSGPALDGGPACFGLSVNTIFHQDTDEWERWSGDAAYLLHLSRDGLTLYGHPASEADTWDHDVGDAHWREIAIWTVDPPSLELSIPGSSGVLSLGASETDIDGVSTGFATNGIGTVIKSPGVASFAISYPIHLPTGAVIQEVKVGCAVDLNAVNVQAAVMRKTLAGVTAPLMLDASGPSDFVDTADINTYVEQDVAVNQLNEVDNASYAYFVRVIAQPAAFIGISKVRIVYTPPRPTTF